MSKYVSIYLLIISILYISTRGYAQKKEGPALIDSLKQRLATGQKSPSRERATTLIKLAYVYLAESDYLHSTQCAEECLSISDQLNDDSLKFEALRTIGTVYFHQSDLIRAQQSDSIAFSLAKKNHNLQQQAAVLKAMGDNYLQMGDSARSEKYYNTALPILIQLGDRRSEAAVYSNQSILCNADYQRKIELAFKAKNIWDKEPPGNTLPTVNTGNIGVAYLDIIRYHRWPSIKPTSLIPSKKDQILELAERYLNEAIRMGGINHDVEDAAYYTGVLAELQEQKGDFKNAYYNFRKYQGVTDSIFSQDNKNKIAALENQGAIDRKNREIENKELQIANQHKKMWLLFGCILFLLVIGVLLVWLNRELANANKVKAKFFAILSHDLRSPLSNLINLIQYNKIKPGSLSQEQIADRENKLTRSASSLLDKVDAVLLWSKGQMEHFKPTIRQVPVNDLWTYIKGYFSDTPGILFVFEGGDDLMITTDAQYLQTIMHNLTANAVKALQHTSHPQITWKAWAQGQKTYLSIRDNGVGIRNEQMIALYDETAINSSRKGLGFHIIRDLARAIGCEITSQSRPPQATEFILSF